MKYFKALLVLSFAIVIAVAALIAIQFPYSTDAPLTVAETAALRAYYTQAYQKPEGNGSSEFESDYIRVAEAAAESFQIKQRLGDFIDRYGLTYQRVLDIGSGRGHLQDMVADYTGLDVSENVGRFYHKKFVLGSATALPFEDSSFDAAWSIWVLEHVPNPEQMLAEMRRVVKDRGLIFLIAAWRVPSWVAEGYSVRPYSDLSLWGKAVKASIPIRSNRSLIAVGSLAIRILRETLASGPTQLRFNRLTPNYSKYWMEDSDAVNSIDVHEALLWFVSRGDECLNCEGGAVFKDDYSPIIVRLRKAPAPST